MKSQCSPQCVTWIIFVLAPLLFCLTSVAQTMEPPGRAWYKSYWPDENLCDGECSQIESGEDWFYDVSVSSDAGTVNGLICTGYQVKQSNLLSPLSCQLSSSFEPYYYCELRDQARNVEPGYYRRGTVWFIDLDGHEKWYVDVGEDFEVVEGRKIIQTYDGNYVMVGDGFVNDPGSSYTPNISYNPGLSTNTMPNGGPLLGIAAKINATTHEIMWMYVFGLSDDFDANLGSAFSDVVEDPATHNLIIAGRAENYLNPPDLEKRMNASIFNLDEDGQLIWKSVITSEAATFSEFNCLKLVVDGTDEYITACGAEAPQGNNYTDRGHGTKSYLANFEYSSTPPSSVNYARYGATTGSKVNFIYDFQYLSNGNLIIPSVEDCTGCPYYSGRPQHAKIYKVNPSTFGIISTTDLGALTAYDMQTGIDATADGGFVFVSTKQVGAPASITTPVHMDDGADVTFSNAYPPTGATPPTSSIGMNDCPNWFWYTNAYIAKFDANANLEWENTYPFTRYDNSVTNRGDITAHECLYEIVQLPDGSFVACGNNSANFDDHILLKINDDCENRLDGSYYIGNSFTSSSYTQHITSNTTWNTDRKIRGTVIIDNGITLTIDGATVEFADTRRTDIPTTLIVDKGGELVIRNNSVLTAITSPCTGGVWDGIQVYGDPSLDQSPTSNQGYCRIENSTIEHARIGVRLSESYYEPEYYWYTPIYSKTGGIVETYQAHFVDNWKDVEFMKYNSPSGTANTSYFQKTDFTFTGGFPDPSYFFNGEGEYLGYKDYVSLWDVQGVSFLGCNFENTSTDDITKKGTGITSLNATYNVNDFLEYVLGMPVTTHSTFTNIHRGIEAFMYSAVHGPTLNISNAVFDNVRQGIGISGFTLPYPVISNNTINLDAAGVLSINDFESSWGIHSTGNDYYYIQENHISSNFTTEEVGPYRPVVGIAVNNRHDYNTMIYKNWIELMRTSILPFGWNGTEGDDDGLLLKCNTQSDNFENDIKVINDGVVVGMIKDNQGGCQVSNDDYVTPAGNIFTDNSNIPSNIQLNTTNSVSQYTYYFRDLNIPETPVTYSMDVTVSPCMIPYYDDQLCPTKIVIDNGDWSDEGWDWSAKIAEAESETSKETIEKLYYNYLMNSNQTDGIITYLNGKTTKNYHDSLILFYAHSALRHYDSALSVLATIGNVNDDILLLRNITQAQKADSLYYNFKTPLTDSLYSIVLDSTNIRSLYAENILRLTDNQYYSFRIPEDDSVSYRTPSLQNNSNLSKKVESYVTLYPNPNNGSFSICFVRENMKNINSLSIYDVTGREALTKKITADKFKYDINLQKANGIYLLRVYSVDGTEDDSRVFTIK